MYELDIICNHILDIDILLIQTILKNIVNIISYNPILFAGELILRLRNIKYHYNKYIESLFVQANNWCESFNKPIFVPLSSWISTIPPLTITVLSCHDKILKIVGTTFNQDVLCTTNSNEIIMYHIPSKKLVKKFCGTIELK